MTEPRRLTDYADCAGCASKLGPAELDAVMAGLPPGHVDERVLVDFRTADDAGVYRWSDESALVQTVDFFTPMVDDPYVFGQVAAANALSDVYAMGGTPRVALALAAFPKDGPSPESIREIFRGGADMLRQAGVALLGGHTVTDPEVKFGYAVTGHVDPNRIWRNATARVGDVLVLTKPLGTGIVVRATKFGRSTQDQLLAAIDSMITLNSSAAEAAKSLPGNIVGACTDVTGFGLSGHATEIALASDTTLAIDVAALPLLPGAFDLAIQNLPCGGRSNQRYYERIRVDPAVPRELFLICCDPQTSGGLLFTVDSSSVGGFLAALRAAGVSASAIGEVEPRAADGALVRLYVV